MAEAPWQQQFKQFINKAGEELKRTGEEIKAEAQRLMVEVRDPQKQQKMKEGLRDLSSWARKTADQAADLIDAAVKKAEQTWGKPAAKGQKSEATPPSKAAAPEPVTEKVQVTEEKSAQPAAKAPKKTVGKKKSGSKAAPRAAGKTIGKKKKPS